ncbi:MAG: HipA N-terminal domain-containing protein, partial [Planctomycetes bacterium]|nr:HipA N-terminal domain-containing protein [Planctomycetota bacterium]
MSTIAEVKMWGSTIGAVTLEDGEQTASFQYDPDFSQSGIEV